MIIEKMTYTKNKGEIYAKLLFLKKNAKHMKQEVFKDTPEENFLEVNIWNLI